MGQKPSSKRGTNLRIFVKKGATRRYERLKRDSASLPVKVEWDRRSGERRSPTQPAGAEAVGLPVRKTDRRQAPPFTWELAEFVVVEDPDGTDDKKD